MKLRHRLALLGVVLIAWALAAPLLARNWWSIAGIFLSLGVLCISVAAIITPEEGD